VLSGELCKRDYSQEKEGEKRDEERKKERERDPDPFNNDLFPEMRIET